MASIYWHDILNDALCDSTYLAKADSSLAAWIGMDRLEYNRLGEENLTLAGESRKDSLGPRRRPAAAEWRCNSFKVYVCFLAREGGTTGTGTRLDLHIIGEGFRPKKDWIWDKAFPEIRKNFIYTLWIRGLFLQSIWIIFHNVNTIIGWSPETPESGKAASICISYYT